jgi:demethylmenaquinone methyltransferase/2-methoxy-6-polyprenyl-1,4-benzoquinol methylase
MEENIYDPAFVADLFDRCSPRYRRWSAAASFGAIWFWRRTCAMRLRGQVAIAAHKGARVNLQTPEILDLMAGTGELWPHLLSHFPRARITAIDISENMHKEAVSRLHGPYAHRIQHFAADALTTDIPDASADFVVSSFGLKTLTRAGQRRLAERTARSLRPGGAFSMIEASDPKGWMLRPLYRAYLDAVLPMVERAALRGAKDFSMLGTYTRNFGNCGGFAEDLRAQGLFVSEARHIFGCATSVAGFKPVAAPDTKP